MHIAYTAHSQHTPAHTYIHTHIKFTHTSTYTYYTQYIQYTQYTHTHTIHTCTSHQDSSKHILTHTHSHTHTSKYTAHKYTHSMVLT